MLGTRIEWNFPLRSIVAAPVASPGVFPMRLAILTLLAAAGFAGLAVPGGAAPIAPRLAVPEGSLVVEVAGGCGRAFHRSRWGHCVPNRYRYARPYRYWTPWPGYVDGHQPWNRPSPRDHVANRLNRQVLRGNYYGY